jgi:type II secretory pathway pseudopilin PulG
MSLTTCPECAKPVSSEAIACPACGHPIKPSPTPAKKTGLWWGLGGLLGGLLAVPAILMVVAIIGLLSGLLSSIAIPSFMRARTTSQANACINNLRQIEAAKHAYALEQGLTNGATVTFENIGPTAPGGGYLKAWPGCPSSAHAARTRSSAENDYDINVIGQNPRCRIVPDKHAFAESHDDSSLNPSIVVSDSSSNPNITVSNCTAKVALGGNRAKKTNGFSCVSSI